MPPVPVRKTGYRSRAIKRGKSPDQVRMKLFDRTPCKPKDLRNIGHTVQFVQPYFDRAVMGATLIANVGDFARYEGEQYLLEVNETRCAIRLKSGTVVYLLDDGKVFCWCDAPEGNERHE